MSEPAIDEQPRVLEPVHAGQGEPSGEVWATRLVVFLPDSGSFGHVCVCDFRDEELTISNGGHCPLTITAVTSSSSEFAVPDVSVFPITIAPGTATEVPIRFQPTSYGDKSATLTITSDDPGGPRTLGVSGYAPHGVLAYSGTTDFGRVDLGKTAQTQLVLANVGECNLHVCRVAFRPQGPCSCISGGAGRGRCSCCGYRHHGSGCGCDCGHDDRDGVGYNDKIHESTLPATQEPPTDPCSFCHQHDWRCGRCQCCAQFELVNNPFPTTLRPGATLPLTITFTPTCEFNPCCELVICTDDPGHERTSLLVTGHLNRTLATALKCWAGQEIRDMIAGGGC